MTTGYEDDEVAVARMSPEDLRAAASSRRAAEAGLRDSAKRYRRMAHEEGRAADQCGHEAVFLDQAAVALDALQQARRQLPALKAAAEGAVTAERLADDKLRRAARNLTRRQAEERRISGRENVAPDLRDEAAVRTLRASRTVDEERPALATEQARRVQTEQNLAGHQLRLAELETAWAAAAWRAQHPGEAPRTSPMALGAVSAADMTEEERQLIGGLALLAGLGHGERAPARPDPAATLRDQTRFRALGPGVIIPPGVRP